MKQIPQFNMQHQEDQNEKLPIGHTNTTLGYEDDHGQCKQEIFDIGSLNVENQNQRRLSNKDQKEISKLFFTNEKDQAVFNKYMRKKQIKKQKNYYKYQKIWKFQEEQKPNFGAYHISEKNVLKLNVDFQSDSEENVQSFELPPLGQKLSFILKDNISKNYSLQNFCISLKSLLEQNKFKRIHKVFKCHLCNSYYQQQSLQEHMKQHNNHNMSNYQIQSSNKLRDFYKLYYQHQLDN